MSEEGSGDNGTSFEDATIQYRYFQCQILINQSKQAQDEGARCEATFDGWSCWPETPAGSTAFTPCPHFITGFDPSRDLLSLKSHGGWQSSTVAERYLEDSKRRKLDVSRRLFRSTTNNPGPSSEDTNIDVKNNQLNEGDFFTVDDLFSDENDANVSTKTENVSITRQFIPQQGMAHKLCTENGTWYKHPASALVWSNYTTCINLDDLTWRQNVNNIYQAGYSFSLVALLLSLFILSYFKTLRCPRNTLHMNLFTAFAFNNLLWLLWYRMVVPFPSVILDNGVWCQCLHVVLHYFLLSCYAWMLAEGIYLHTLLVSAFTSEQRLVRVLTVFSWTSPFFFITLYTVLRLATGDTAQCWIDESDYNSVLVVLVVASMGLNLVFLCNIVRVVVVKLRAGPSQTSRPSRYDPKALLQALRATLLLLPLLGLNYLLTPFRPPTGNPWESYYEIMSAVTASFQGLCVATLFCFCNGEVVAQIKRKWQYATFRTRANSYTATTVSFVRSTAAPVAEEENV